MVFVFLALVTEFATKFTWKEEREYETIEARIAEAWGHLLMTQHHDGWICAAAGWEALM